jgi:hypothetical protein
MNETQEQIAEVIRAFCEKVHGRSAEVAFSASLTIAFNIMLRLPPDMRQVYMQLIRNMVDQLGAWDFSEQPHEVAIEWLKENAAVLFGFESAFVSSVEKLEEAE